MRGLACWPGARARTPAHTHLVVVAGGGAVALLVVAAVPLVLRGWGGAGVVVGSRWGAEEAPPVRPDGRTAHPRMPRGAPATAGCCRTGCGPATAGCRGAATGCCRGSATAGCGSTEEGGEVVRGARRAALRSVWRWRSERTQGRPPRRRAGARSGPSPRPSPSPLRARARPTDGEPGLSAHTSGGRPARVRVTLVTGGQGMSRQTPRAPAALRPRSPRPPMSDAESLADGTRAHACRPLLPARALPPRRTHCGGCVRVWGVWRARSGAAERRWRARRGCPWRGARPPPRPPRSLSPAGRARSTAAAATASGEGGWEGGWGLAAASCARGVAGAGRRRPEPLATHVVRLPARRAARLRRGRGGERQRGVRRIGGGQVGSSECRAEHRGERRGEVCGPRPPACTVPPRPLQVSSRRPVANYCESLRLREPTPGASSPRGLRTNRASQGGRCGLGDWRVAAVGAHERRMGRSARRNSARQAFSSKSPRPLLPGPSCQAPPALHARGAELMRGWSRE